MDDADARGTTMTEPVTYDSGTTAPAAPTLTDTQQRILRYLREQ